MFCNIIRKKCFYNNLKIINEKIAFLTDKNKFVPERVNGQFQISFNFWPTFHYTFVEVMHTVWRPWNITITFRILTTVPCFWVYIFIVEPHSNWSNNLNSCNMHHPIISVILSFTWNILSHFYLKYSHEVIQTASNRGARLVPRLIPLILRYFL